MSELTLEAFGYRDREAAVTRRIRVLLHEQDAAKPLPDWLRQKSPWAIVTASGAELTRGVVVPIRSVFGMSEPHLEKTT